ncbi:MAG: isopentenyl-diphosphate Delta-isomerase [Actinobacteria bacterium]|uniref:isopentenyl-diphosphate Delta-isomerase n=1 Tax=freshwater metagenome TaxID=449393 RepID=A0A6J6Q827_9ZZZZ|nr:isopentenyl-diphosphate Delta-isomerase [Actinomycetota bacterium]
MADTELVVLLYPDGTVAGSLDKSLVHHSETPLHLAFSCYVFDTDNRLLMSQRALSKLTFPGLWTNSVCGHPLPGETVEAAAARRCKDELGLVLTDLRLILPTFAYRAEMNGLVENEMCPVLMAIVAPGALTTPDPAEVEATNWVPWAEVVRDTQSGTLVLSPWCLTQIDLLDQLGPEPAGWPTGAVELLPAALRTDGDIHT